MPLYEYEPCGGSCGICRGKFTLNRPLSAPELVQCPLCRKPVQKMISGFSTPRIIAPLSVTDAKKAGFSVWKRVGKGEYERE
jgi:putative FmdB family regulatory protein